MSALKFPALVLLLSTFIQPAWSWFESKSFESGQIELFAPAKYFRATANYTSNGGEFERLAADHSYQQYEIKPQIRWTLFSRGALFAGLTAAGAQSESQIASRSNSNVSDAWLGADALLLTSTHWDLIPEFKQVFPIQRVDPNTDAVLISEGSMESMAALHLRGEYKVFHPQFKIGAIYRDEGRSNLGLVHVGSEFKFDQVFLGLEYRSTQSISKDIYTDQENERHRMAAYNGGALKFYNVNPILNEGWFWMRLVNPSGLQFQFGGSSTINGRSSAAGWTVFGALTMSFASLGKSNPVLSTPAVDSKPTPNFEEETNDGVDQSLFQQNEKKVIDPFKSKQQKLEEKKIQEDLNKTEIEIELRQIEKKKRRSR